MSFRTVLSALIKKPALVPVTLVMSFGLVALTFQNCSKVGFAQSSDSLESTASLGNSQTVYTDFNTPKTFTANFTAGSVSNLALILQNGSTTMTLASGSTVTVTDPINWALTYTPANGFRESETTTIYLKDRYGNQLPDVVTFTVANAVRDIQPAMAVRTSGCITCHASVASNYITDFGAGSSYFFGSSVIANNKNPLAGSADALYSDRYPDMSWLSASFTSGIIIPKQQFGFDLASYVKAYVTANQIGAGALPAANDVIANITPTSTLADYLKIMENHKTAAANDSANIIEKTSIYIGAPTVAVLKARTQLGSARMRFVKNVATSPDVSGLVDKSTYYQADNLTCDGDLVVNGPIYLHNLNLKTDTGCRIYATGSIFVNGPITYSQITPSSTDTTNLQLVSAEWINMGVGQTHCETAASGGWYYSNNVANPYSERLLAFPAPTRVATTDVLAKALNTTFGTEQQSIAGFIDASCETGSQVRAIPYTRLLLNAPRIDSRYTGQVTGVVIAEVAIFGLQRFAFTFDPVFNNVPILPFLQTGDYLSVQ